MASLTQTSIVARKTIRYGIYAIILIIIGRLLFNSAVTLYKRLFPPPPPKPTVAFGKLPPPAFPEKSPPELTYKLETVDGQLPKLPTQAKVYFMPPSATSINAIDEAKVKAQKMGFDPAGRLVVENVPNIYVFQKRAYPSQLTLNIITGVFSISYDLDADPTAVGGLAPSQDSATKIARSTMGAAGLLPDDLNKGRQTQDYLRIEANKFVPAISQSEAGLTRVNFFRKDYEEGVISVTPDYPTEANVWFIVGGAVQGGSRVIAAEYHYYPVDETKSGTYPLKTVQEAWDELTSGNAYIANLGNNAGEITIRNVYLAHYDAGKYVEFYQPVYVFEGDNQFAAFVPALTADYYSQEGQN